MSVFCVDRFICEKVTGRPNSMFEGDVQENVSILSKEIENRSVCVIGGAGSIGSSFIKSVLRFRPGKLVVIDLSENGLVELTRDIRSTAGLFVPQDYRTYTLDFDNPIFARIFREERGFDIVANFSAHKHVRSEKDKYSVQALIMINLSQHQIQSIASFEERLMQIPEVKVGYHLTGRYDYALHVVLSDIDHLATLIKNTLSKLPGLERQETFLIFSSVKEERGYSLDYAI